MAPSSTTQVPVACKCCEQPVYRCECEPLPDTERDLAADAWDDDREWRQDIGRMS
jgi:hypothetical protein